jgi:hypothetical protein
VSKETRRAADAAHRALQLVVTAEEPLRELAGAVSRLPGCRLAPGALRAIAEQHALCARLHELLDELETPGERGKNRDRRLAQLLALGKVR